MKNLTLFCIVGAAVFCSSCGRDERAVHLEKRTVRRPAAVAPARTSSDVDARLLQLEETLDQLLRENEIQRDRLTAARGDLSALRSSIGGTTATAVREPVAAPAPAHVVVAESDETPARKEAENRVLSILSVIVFLVLIGIILAKLWKGRGENDFSPAPHSRDPDPESDVVFSVSSPPPSQPDEMATAPPPETPTEDPRPPVPD